MGFWYNVISCTSPSSKRILVKIQITHIFKEIPLIVSNEATPVFTSTCRNEKDRRLQADKDNFWRLLAK